MNLEEQIRAYNELGKNIDELEQQKKALGAAIMQQMQEKTMRVADYLVRRYSRLSIKLSTEEARTLDAIKIEEAVDKGKIKALYQLGKPMQGVSEIQYIQISKTNNKEQATVVQPK